ncbi:MAG: LysM peptidoglycan-binding domain-containing protein [Acidimicrobiales bacterium]
MAVRLNGAAIGRSQPNQVVKPTSPNTYTVRLGDTLGALAERFGTTVTALTRINLLADPDFIYVGEVLSLPAGAVSDAPSVTPAAVSPRATARAVPAHRTSPTGAAVRAVPVAPSAPTAVPTRAPQASQSGYTVRLGDTLATVAARLGNTPALLAEINRLADPNFVYVGEVLSLSGVPSTVAVHARSASAPAVQVRSTQVRAARTSLATRALPSAQTLSARTASLPAAQTRVTPAVSTRWTPAPAVQTRVAPAVSPLSATTSATSSSTGAPSANVASTATRVALAQVGKPYVYGGAGPSSYDCSGLVTYAYAAAGVTLAHYTVSQYSSTTPVSGSQLSSGDLVFYNTGSGAQPGHVAIYVGAGKVVSANRPGTFVQTQSLSYDGTATGFRRVR